MEVPLAWPHRHGHSATHPAFPTVLSQPRNSKTALLSLLPLAPAPSMRPGMLEVRRVSRLLHDTNSCPQKTPSAIESRRAGGRFGVCAQAAPCACWQPGAVQHHLPVMSLAHGLPREPSSHSCTLLMPPSEATLAPPLAPESTPAVGGVEGIVGAQVFPGALMAPPKVTGVATCRVDVLLLQRSRVSKRCIACSSASTKAGMATAARKGAG